MRGERSREFGWGTAETRPLLGSDWSAHETPPLFQPCRPYAVVCRSRWNTRRLEKPRQAVYALFSSPMPYTSTELCKSSKYNYLYSGKIKLSENPNPDAILLILPL
ncbi:unnamed protein product [Discosporangium mesarthrocarpum]